MARRQNLLPKSRLCSRPERYCTRSWWQSRTKRRAYDAAEKCGVESQSCRPSHNRLGEAG